MTPPVLLVLSAVVLLPLLANLPRCYRAILNDARIISKDPALQSQLEILYAYPGQFVPVPIVKIEHVAAHVPPGE